MRLLLLAVAVWAGERAAAPARPDAAIGVSAVAGLQTSVSVPALRAAGALPDAALPAALPQSPASAAAAAAAEDAVGQAVAAQVQAQRLAAGLARDASSQPAGDAGSALLDQAFAGARSRPDGSITPAPIEGGRARPGFLARFGARAAAAYRRSKAPPLAQKLVGGEGVPAGLAGMAFVWSFLTIMTYSIIGPVRSAYAVINAGPQLMPLVFIACAIATGLVVAGYSAVSKRVSKRALIAGTLGSLSAMMAGWWAVFAHQAAVVAALGAVASPSVATQLLSGAFFVWADIFGVMAVTLFWSYANDLFHSPEARKGFGFIAAGAEIGSMVGSGLTALAVAALGTANMLLVAAGVFSLTLAVFAAMEWLRGASGAAAPEAAAKKDAPPAGDEGWAGLKRLFTSKLLMLLGAVVFLERLIPDFSFYIYNFVMHDAFPDKTAFAAAAAQFTFFQNVVSFGASIAFAAYVLPRIGMAGALMSAALVNMLGLGFTGAFGAFLGVVVGYNALEGLLRYTWFKSAKEMVYTTLDKAVLYRVKAFIEMFVYRFARGIAGAILLGVSVIAPLVAGDGATAHEIARVSMTLAAAIGAPFAALWAWSAWRLGREFKKLEPAESPR